MDNLINALKWFEETKAVAAAFKPAAAVEAAIKIQHPIQSAMPKAVTAVNDGFKIQHFIQSAIPEWMQNLNSYSPFNELNKSVNFVSRLTNSGNVYNYIPTKSEPPKKEQIKLISKKEKNISMATCAMVMLFTGKKINQIKGFENPTRHTKDKVNKKQNEYRLFTKERIKCKRKKAKETVKILNVAKEYIRQERLTGITKIDILMQRLELI